MFHKNNQAQEQNEIDKIENEIEQLRPEEATLARECDLLHGKAMAEDFVPEKHKIMAEKAELYTKLSHIQNTINLLTEKQALPKVDKLLKENLSIIKLMINNSRIEIAENTDVVIPFEGCNHTLKMALREILRFQTTMTRNCQLLSSWEIALREGSTITRSILCVECLKQKKKRLNEGFNVPSKRTGTASIVITIFK